MPTSGTGDFKVEVNLSRCENKQSCVQVCPVDVFEMVKPTGIRNPLLFFKIRVHGGLVAAAVREPDCIGCMACVEACPEDAITVTASLP